MWTLRTSAFLPIWDESDHQTIVINQNKKATHIWPVLIPVGASGFQLIIFLYQCNELFTSDGFPL